MVLKSNTSFEVSPFLLKKYIRVRKAKRSDVDQIYEISCSVGTDEKDSEKGFLVDNYLSNPSYYKSKIRKTINTIDHFYIAEFDKIYGFLIAYTKDEWLLDNKTWIQDIFWKPDFCKNALDKFILVDKTAIRQDLTGHGIGSIIYDTLISDLRAQGIYNILAETIISPKPNFASLNFRNKQNYNLAGVRYEHYLGQIYTDLIYHKTIN